MSTCLKTAVILCCTVDRVFFKSPKFSQFGLFGFWESSNFRNLQVLVMTNYNIDSEGLIHMYNVHTAKFSQLLCYPTSIMLDITYHGMTIFLCASVGDTQDNQPNCIHTHLHSDDSK